MLNCIAISPACADGLVCSREYTLNADFDEGTLLNVNHGTDDQLQLNQETKSFPFIWVACSGRGTIVRIDVNTGEVLGEYRSAPEGRDGGPTRTAVDLYGNVWVSNADESDSINGVPNGSVVKIGLVIGGTRVDEYGNPDSDGEYLKPPFIYSTAVDRDGDGLIKTSRGLGDVLAWPDLGDGQGGAGGGSALVNDAEDECILIYQRLPGAPSARHVSVTKDNDVWVGGYPGFEPAMFLKLKGTDGAIIESESFDAQEIGAGGYGGFIDGNNVLWSASLSQGLLRYDLETHSWKIIEMWQSSGLGIDSNGYIWNAHTYFFAFAGAVAKIAPDGTIVGVFDSNGYGPFGVAVTPVDDNVWIVNSWSWPATVARLDNDGKLRKTIAIDDAYSPTGVAVDANGKVWVTCLRYDSNENIDYAEAVRIDPTKGTDGLGEVDFIVNLGAEDYFENYSDMTGNVIPGIAQQGTWTVVHDSLVSGTAWGTVSWTSDEPEKTAIKVYVRAADNVAGLTGKPFVQVENGVSFCDKDIAGQYIEIQAVFSRDFGVQETPVLYDLTVKCCNQPPVAVCQNVTVCTDPGTCSAEVSAADVDGGSYDPDGDPITLTIDPPGPYPLGITTVTLTVTDPLGEIDQCQATIEVIDCEAPAVACVPTTNPAGSVVPPAGTNPKSGQNPDGFYQLLASDNCDPTPSIYVVDSISGFVAGPFASGDKVKITQAPGGKPVQKPLAGVIVAHITLRGDPVVMAVDAAGNQAVCNCYVPPPPK